ncbi:MAG: trehalose-6-phosphate synthase [Phycisphaerales bacterium]
MAERSDIVIVSNRLPVHEVKEDGETRWETSPGGLVSALTPILRQRPSTWIGWTGAAGDAPDPFEHDGIRNRPVALSASEIKAFYEGFSNRTLWPLYHDCVRPPEYRRRWWWPYVDVNRRFADAAAEVVGEGGLVWVHDYHLQLVPAMLREKRPDIRIGFFLHIPFPPQELFAQIPWRRQILEGLLGADVVGFQTRVGAQNFALLARRFLEVSGGRDALRYKDRVIRADDYPISIDTEKFESLAGSDTVRRRMQRFRSRLGDERKVILGVDRMDYTKGIDIRLRAYQELLRSKQATLDDCVFVQVAVPSRERVVEYRELKASVEQLIGQINGEFGELGRTPIHYLHRSMPPEQLVALYLAAEVMLVTPLRDGMNLVAKEYCATRLDDTGSLILSEFTGSAHELASALLVNPHDIDGLQSVLHRALKLPVDEQRRRMRSMRRSVQRNDVYRWANSFLEALEA